MIPTSAVYLDENVDLMLAAALRDRGFTVSSAHESRLLGADDGVQLQFATEHGWLILSHNRKHFQRWHRLYHETGREHGGIVVVPSNSPLPVLAIRAAILLDWIATQGAARSRLFTWGMLQELLEQGFRLPGYSEEEVQVALGR